MSRELRVTSTDVMVTVAFATHETPSCVRLFTFTKAVAVLPKSNLWSNTTKQLTSELTERFIDDLEQATPTYPPTYSLTITGKVACALL